MDKPLRKIRGRLRLATTMPTPPPVSKIGPLLEKLRDVLGGGEGGDQDGAGGSGGAVAAGGLPPRGAPDDSDDDADAAAPSALLGPLLEDWRHVLVKHVLQRLNPTDCTLLARVAKPWMAVVVANNLPCAGKGGAEALQLRDFVGSVEMLAWAEDHGCQWDEGTCAAGSVRASIRDGSPRVDTWRCCSGRGSTIARGMRGRV
jgi:hypothetical protein